MAHTQILAANGISEVQPLENPLGNHNDRRHDPSPEPRQVDDVRLLSDRFHDSLGNGIRLRPKNSFGKVSGHWRIDKSRLDGDHWATHRRKTIAKTLQKDVEHAFGSAIDVVALPTPIPCHRSDHHERTLANTLKMVGEMCTQTDGAQGVVVNCFQRRRHILLARLLVR